MITKTQIKYPSTVFVIYTITLLFSQHEPRGSQLRDFFFGADGKNRFYKIVANCFGALDLETAKPSSTP